MASQEQVREYLAYWFQLGKGIIIDNDQSVHRPQPVLQGDRLSPEFEDCWAQIMAHGGSNCYLESTSITLDQLLTSSWEIDECPRCDLPVAIPAIPYRIEPCPCSDLMHWPNFEVPYPHLPVNTQAHLTTLSERLQAKESPEPSNQNQEES